MKQPHPEPTSDRQWQEGFRPGAPGAFLGAVFTAVWLLWFIQAILDLWQHPLALVSAFLLLPLAAFVALNLVNLALAATADGLTRLLPPIRRWQRQAIVGCMFVIATTCLAVWALAKSQGLLPRIGGGLWIAGLLCYSAWSLASRNPSR